MLYCNGSHLMADVLVRMAMSEATPDLHKAKLDVPYLQYPGMYALPVTCYFLYISMCYPANSIQQMLCITVELDNRYTRYTGENRSSLNYEFHIILKIFWVCYILTSMLIIDDPFFLQSSHQFSIVQHYFFLIDKYTSIHRKKWYSFSDYAYALSIFGTALFCLMTRNLSIFYTYIQYAIFPLHW